MDYKEKVKLFNDVFSPKKGENVIILVDTPHNQIKDSEKWSQRREMAEEWYKDFKKLAEKKDFNVEFKEYKATGLHNKFLPEELCDYLKNSNLVIAMTEYSASSTLFKVCKEKDSITRGASMPGVERRMENTAFKADYIKVRSDAKKLEKILSNAVSAEVKFSTADFLFVDLRNREAKHEAGECTKPGDCINFPSGEAWKVPYEASPDEKEEFGESKTEGMLPQKIDGELVRYQVKNNKIRTVL